MLKGRIVFYAIGLLGLLLLVGRIADRFRPGLDAHRAFDAYKGPSTETYPVTMAIGDAQFIFPRNFILVADNSNGWNVFLVGETLGEWGLTVQNAWMSRSLPAYPESAEMITAEIGTGNPFKLSAHFQAELQKQKPASEECALPGYHFLGATDYIATGIPKPVFITCFDPLRGIRNCHMVFDDGNNVGVKVHFNGVNLCYWKAIQDSVDRMLAEHMSRAAR